MDMALTNITDTTIQTTMTDIAGQLARTSQRTYANDARHFASWLQNEGLTLDRLTRSDVIAYRSHLAESTYAKATKQRMFSVASRLVKECHLSGKIASNVASDVRGFKVNNETTHTALTKQQVNELLSVVDQSTIMGKRDYALLSLLIKTGIRRAEAVALNQGDIRMMNGHNVAVIEHAKEDKRHIVKLRVEVKRALDAYIQTLPVQEANAPIFVSVRRGDHPTVNRMTDKTVELIVKKYADRTPHDLRSTFITLALESKAPLEKVQFAVGHEDPRTTLRYQKRKLNLDDNAVDYLNF